MFKYSSFKIHHTISKKFVSAEGSLQCFEVQEIPPLSEPKKTDHGEDFQLKYPAETRRKRFVRLSCLIWLSLFETELWVHGTGLSQKKPVVSPAPPTSPPRFPPHRRKRRAGWRGKRKELEWKMLSRYLYLELCLCFWEGFYPKCKLSIDFFVSVPIHSFISSCFNEYVVVKYAEAESNKDENKGRNGRKSLIKENPIEKKKKTKLKEWKIGGKQRHRLMIYVSARNQKKPHGHDFEM